MRCTDRLGIQSKLRASPSLMTCLVLSNGEGHLRDRTIWFNSINLATAPFSLSLLTVRGPDDLFNL